MKRLALALLALAACVHRPDYSLCGVPYTDEEDAAGIEHECPPEEETES